MATLGKIGLTVGAAFVALAVYGLVPSVRQSSVQAQDKANRMRFEGAEFVEGYHWTFWHDTETGAHFVCMDGKACAVTNPAGEAGPPTGLEAKAK